MVELKFFDESDFKQLIDWVDSPEFLMQFSGPSFTYPLDENQLSNYIKDTNNKDPHTLIYKAVLKDTGKTIGHISLTFIDKSNKSARIARVLVGDLTLRGQGVGAKIIDEILKIAFEDLNLHRVSLGVFDFNKGAIACYEKAGFVKEGLLRDFRKLGDEYWNLYEMSMLDHEWRALKKNLNVTK